jgi:hypothetical protein
VKELIQGILNAKLQGVTYHSENTSQWTREIADEIKTKLKGLACKLVFPNTFRASP